MARLATLDSTLVVRGFAHEVEFVSLDGNRSAVTAEAHSMKGGASHVSLAACRTHESAFEKKGRGVFTKALIETLRTFGPGKLTYRELVRSMPELSR